MNYLEFYNVNHFIFKYASDIEEKKFSKDFYCSFMVRIYTRIYFDLFSDILPTLPIKSI
jgi:hypothetical protein